MVLATEAGCEMTKKTSPDEPGSKRDLARFLQDWTALWREEVHAQTKEPGPLAGLAGGITPEMAAAMEMWRVAMAASAEAFGVPPSMSGRARERTSAPRPQAVAAASDARDAEVERLARRVDELEARLAKLETPRRGRG
jgi:hypothetical protein